jgi:hypothetical protein
MHYSPHSFRATGITNFLENGGTLEVAQRIAGHADSRTTKLYDRRGQKSQNSKTSRKAAAKHRIVGYFVISSTRVSVASGCAKPSDSPTHWTNFSQPTCCSITATGSAVLSLAWITPYS